MAVGAAVGISVAVAVGAAVGVAVGGSVGVAVGASVAVAVGGGSVAVAVDGAGDGVGVATGCGGLHERIMKKAAISPTTNRTTRNSGCLRDVMVPSKNAQEKEVHFA